jgi:hypothetical protein
LWRTTGLRWLPGITHMHPFSSETVDDYFATLDFEKLVDFT